MSTEGPKIRDPRFPRKSDRFPVVKKKHRDLFSKEELVERWSIIQHDTRGIILAALGTVSTIEAALQRDVLTPEKLLKYTAILKSSVERIQHILLQNNLDEEYRLRIEEINLLELLGELGAQFHFTEPNGKLELSLDKSLDRAIEADRFLLADIFTNLILNTHEALDAVGSLRISSQSMGDHVNIWLTDNGPGIATSIREKLFMQGTSTKEGSVTRGTGLFGVQRNVRLHGGSLKLVTTVTRAELESKPAGTKTGTTFIISLPKRQTIEEELETGKELA